MLLKLTQSRFWPGKPSWIKNAPLRPACLCGTLPMGCVHVSSYSWGLKEAMVGTELLEGACKDDENGAFASVRMLGTEEAGFEEDE